MTDNFSASFGKSDVPVNTEKNNKKAASLLREYLTETEQSSNFEALSAQQLNDVLKSIFISVLEKQTAKCTRSILLNPQGTP
jgi:hypothetical protein